MFTLSTLNKVKTVLLPIFWLETDIRMGTEITSNLELLNQVVKLMKIVPFVMLGLGVAIMFLAFITFFVSIISKVKNDSKIHSEKKTIQNKII